MTRRSWTREKTGGDSPYLQQILMLHKQQLTSVEIGRRLGKDHTTVLYHLRRLGIPTGVKFSRKVPVQVVTIVAQTSALPRRPIFKPSKYDYLFEEPVNQGKSYKEYLEDAGKTPSQIKRILADKAHNARCEDGVASLPNGYQRSK